MKTSISIPDSVFEAAENLAKRLGISRSRLYTIAIARFVDTYDAESITAALNEVYAEKKAAVDPMLAQMQIQFVALKDSSLRSE